MACFTVPLAEALVVSAVKAIVANKHKTDALVAEGKSTAKLESFKEKIGWLEKLLYGGSALLAIEHIYHGEVILYPPFLTAMKNPEDIPEMLHEMATVGVGMALLTTAVWGVMLLVSALKKKSGKKTIAGEAV